jgi:hypothetical protein
VASLKKAIAAFTISFFACHLLAIWPPAADLDRSGAVDLVDAIMAVQGLHSFTQVVTAEEPGSQSDLGAYLLNAVEAFKVLAGMKSLSPVKPVKTLSSSASFVALLPTLSVNHELPMTLFPKTADTFYQSIEPEPWTPPPKSSFFPAC